MEQEKIRELLERYFEGKTTEEEELKLKNSLSDPLLPEEMRRELLLLAEMAGPAPVPSEGFADRLEAVTNRKATLKPTGSLFRLITGIAAAAAIVTGIWLAFRLAIPDQPEDTYSDPAIAMAEVKNILLDVSGKMNTGAAQLVQVGTIAKKPQELEGLDRLGDIIGKNLSRLHYLDELVAVQDEKEINQKTRYE